MKCFDWSEQLVGGFYADGVAIAIAPDIEMARRLVHAAYIQNARQRRYKWDQIEPKDRPQYEKCIEESAASFMQTLLTQEPVIRELPYALVRDSVD